MVGRGKSPGHRRPGPSETRGFPMLYVDPSAGSIVLQVALAAIVGGAVTAKRWLGAVKRGVHAAARRLGIR